MTHHFSNIFFYWHVAVLTFAEVEWRQPLTQGMNCHDAAVVHANMGNDGGGKDLGGDLRWCWHFAGRMLYMFEMKMK